MALSVHQLRCVLLRRAADRLGAVFVVHIELALPEVSQLYLPIRVYQHIFRLQVTLDDRQPVQLADHDDHLRDVKHGHVLIQTLVFGGCNVEEQLAPGAVVHDEADVL